MSIAELLQVMNEILASSIVVLAFSMLLYNLTQDLHNRIARTSGIVLACVTLPYVCDVFLSLNPETRAALLALRLQWIGIAFMPAALFHLSDALLATTGLPSRGRRRRIIRIFYGLSTVFLAAVLFTNALVEPLVVGTTLVIEAGPLAVLFIIYFISVVIVTFINMQRAKDRALTRKTRRRMAYLQYAILLPAVGIFPFSIFINSSDEHALPITALVIAANVVVIAMLIFLSYPLGFFGSNKPDRVVKVELLHFLLRGPGTGLLALAVIVLISPATRIIGLDNEDFLPFAVVAVVLMWQWGIALAMPYLEYLLIYRSEDDEQLTRLNDLNERILTRNDLLQFSEATLEAICDYLRVQVAFLLSVKEREIEVVQAVGITSIGALVQEHEMELRALLSRQNGSKRFAPWLQYQILALRSQRMGDDNPVIGILGIEATAETLQTVEQDMLRMLILRAEQTLEDLRLQAEIFASLEGLLPQMSTSRQRADAIEFSPAASSEEQTNREEFYEQVRAALRHYWGGPGISRSRLIDLNIVRRNVAVGEPMTHALRNVLEEAIERQRPPGERSMTAPEWTIYNILTLRFLEGKKVRDVARRMSLSEADLYRKQRLAIEALADTLLLMEAETTAK
jgi:uncharacterized membrane protein